MPRGGIVPYENGRAFEQRIMRKLRNTDLLPVHSAGSRGLFDVMSVKRNGQIRLVVARKTGNISEGERAKLVKFLARIPENIRWLYIIELWYYKSEKVMGKMQLFR